MILRVAVRQFVRTRRVWVGVFVVATVAATMTSASFLQISTAQALPAAEGQAILSLAYGQSAFSLLATLIIAGSTAGFAVTATRTALARLQLAGVTPTQIVVAVSAQTVCASLLGVAIGGGIGLAVAQTWLDASVTFTSIDHRVLVNFRASDVLLAATTVAGVMVLGALRAAIAAGRAPVVQAVRGNNTQSRRRMSAGQLILAIAAIGVATAFTVGLLALEVGGERSLDKKSLSLVVGLSVLFVIAMLALVAATAGIAVPALSTAWAAVIPASWSVSWHLARSGLRRSRGRTHAAVTPIIIAVTVPSALMTVFLTSGSAMGGGSASNVNIGGLLVLIAPALTITLVGSAVLALMASTAQRGQPALVEVLGASQSLATKMAFAEASITMVTGAIAAFGIVILSGQLTSAAFSSELGVQPVVSYSSVGVAAGSAWLLVVLIMTLPVLPGRPLSIADAALGPE